MKKEDKLLISFIAIALIAPISYILGVVDWIETYYYFDYLKVNTYESNTSLQLLFLGVMGTITVLYGFYLFKRMKLFSERLIIVFGLIINGILALCLPLVILEYFILDPLSQSIG